MSFTGTWGKVGCCNEYPAVGGVPSPTPLARALYLDISIVGYWYPTAPVWLSSTGNPLTVTNFSADFNRLTYSYRVFTGEPQGTDEGCSARLMLVTYEDITPIVFITPTRRQLKVTKMENFRGKFIWKVGGCY